MTSFDIVQASCAAAETPEAPESMLLPDRRARKVGALPLQARMVLDVARRCLPLDLAAAGERRRYGVSLGTLFGSMDAAQACLEAVQREGFRGITPSWYATGLPNATAAIVAAIHDLQGPNLTALGYNAGLEAIILGCRQLRAGRATGMLAGAFDLPTARFAQVLRASPGPFSTVGELRPAAALLWLSPTRAGQLPLARVLGWSQASGRVQGRELVAEASRGRHLPSAQVHEISPDHTRCDHLSATSVVRLVQLLQDPSASGLHALIVRGGDSRASCLLIDKPAPTSGEPQ